MQESMLVIDQSMQLERGGAIKEHPLSPSYLLNDHCNYARRKLEPSNILNSNDRSSQIK
jgi:hypothetical protein